jgi:hypothetical protein
LVAFLRVGIPAEVVAPAQQKSPARHPARASRVVLVNTFFWKILVTRVNREMGSATRAETQYLPEIATTRP